MHERLERELLIVGGGPAGLAAAIEARAAGVETLLVDERASLGGQIYKQLPPQFVESDHASETPEHRAGQALIRAAENSGAEIWLGSTGWGIWGHRVAVARASGQSIFVDAKHVILAAGAYDRPVAFPGWTLPGVMSAGGAQSLVKVQRVIPGDRILVVGSGPLVLAFAVQMHQLGANIVGVVEASPPPGLRSALELARSGIANAGQIMAGLGFLQYLRRHRIPLEYSSIIAMAEGEGRVERAHIARCDRSWRRLADGDRVIEVDTICVGYGFFPSTELSQLVQCRHAYDEIRGGYVPVRDEWMRTSSDGILVAGDGGGVNGSAIALEQGRLAGIAVAKDSKRVDAARADQLAAPILRRLKKLQNFRKALDSTYPVGPGIYELADDATVACRCEEVTVAEVRASAIAGTYDPNSVKGVTRAGMGMCQGRNCSRMIASILGRSAGKGFDQVPLFTPRPPVKPVPIDFVAEEAPEEPPLTEVG